MMLLGLNSHQQGYIVGKTSEQHYILRLEKNKHGRGSETGHI